MGETWWWVKRLLGFGKGKEVVKARRTLKIPADERRCMANNQEGNRCPFSWKVEVAGLRLCGIHAKGNITKEAKDE